MGASARDSFDRLFSIIRRLRGPDGCAWDREQSPATLRDDLVEETWEAVSAIDAGDAANLREELGDLYLLVTMIACIHEERASFTVSDVLEGVAEKLVRRHPHVFGDAKPGSVHGILVQWERIKRDERGGDGNRSALDGVPGSLPPLERSAALQKRAARVGFDWPAAEPVWDKLAEETRELREAAASGDARSIEDELGDLLFTVVNLARFLKVDPALSLNRANGKFTRRFQEIERRLAARGTTPAEAGLPAMDEVWNQLRDEERNASK
jgi:tetrapyrrole methylase family protein / MazG family protein